MSTEDQKYSPANQSAVNHAYAAARGIDIVVTYYDAGKSGLTIDRRDALKQLIDDAQSKRAGFEVILVLDVTRWGRFQNPDESAYYEFLCRRAGITVHYCAEEFANDGSPLAAIVKGIKRWMAGEFSRELSVKVFAGQRRLVELGFKLGGVPGYGLRRLLIDHNGVPKCILSPGEQKNISTDRVILVPGPSDEVETVRWIYAMFVHERAGASQIASLLNERGVATGYRHPWTPKLVLQILRSEKYIGNNVWNRESFKLQQKRVRNKRDSWIRADGAFRAIIDKSLFEAAQIVFRGRSQEPLSPRPRKYSDGELLDALRRLLKDRGDVSRRIIAESEGMPSAGTYDARFGNLSVAYHRIGFTPNRNGYGPKIKHRLEGGTRPGRQGLVDLEMLEALRRLLKQHGHLTRELIDESKDVPSGNAYCLHFGSVSRAYQLIGYKPDPDRVRALRALNGRAVSNEALLDSLRELLLRRGRLSSAIIDQERSIPCSSTFENRFGCLMNAYRLIGYVPNRYETRYRRPRGLSNQEMLEALRRLWRKKGLLSEGVIADSKDVPSYQVYRDRFGSLSEACRLIGYSRSNPRKREPTAPQSQSNRGSAKHKKRARRGRSRN